jgi:hypothetical protein
MLQKQSDNDIDSDIRKEMNEQSNFIEVIVKVFRIKSENLKLCYNN